MLLASELDGVKVAVLPLMLTVPATAAPLLSLTVKLEVVIVELVMDLLKVAATVLVTATEVAVFNGVTPVIVGAVVFMT